MGEDKNNNFAEFNCIIKTKEYTKEVDKKEVDKKEVDKKEVDKKEVDKKEVDKKEVDKKEVVVIVKEHLKILLTKFNNVLFLSGAGTSVSAGYPLMKDLLKYLEDLEGLEVLKKKINELLKDLEKNKEDVKQIIKAAKEKTPEKDKDNLEEILNKIDKEDDREKVEKQIVKILNIFEEICKKNPSKYSPHEMLIKKINSFLLNKYRFKIFTTNYDTLFEMACKNLNYIVNDGFVFTDNSYNPLNFGYELIKNQHNDIIDYIPNLIHLYKLHGSLNWRKWEGDRVIKCSDENKNDKPVLIYPNKNKYEDSYNLPYLDMISEFNSALQQKDTLLIVCGYSFSDKHLNNIIERAFNSNNKIHLVIVDPCKLEDNKYYKKAKAYNNISMVQCGFEKFVELLENKSDYMDESKNFYNKKTLEE